MWTQTNVLKFELFRLLTIVKSLSETEYFSANKMTTVLNSRSEYISDAGINFYTGSQSGNRHLYKKYRYSDLKLSGTPSSINENIIIIFKTKDKPNIIKGQQWMCEFKVNLQFL